MNKNIVQNVVHCQVKLNSKVVITIILFIFFGLSKVTGQQVKTNTFQHYLDSVKQDISKNGFIMTDRKLTINDFRGKPIKDGARVGEIVRKMFMYKLNHTAIEGKKMKYAFIIWPYFSYESWINLDTLQRNPLFIKLALQHEQNHYNIHLLTAIMLNKILPSTFFDVNNSIEEINSLETKITTIDDEINKQYDVETNHGKNMSMQFYWDMLVESAYKEKSLDRLIQHCKLKLN